MYEFMSNLRVLLITFNCAEYPFKSYPFPHDVDTPPDILVFALQEIGELGESLRGPTKAINGIENTIEEFKGKYNESYGELLWSQAGTTALVVYVKEGLPELSVDMADIGVGFFGILGNKGAAAVRIHIPIEENDTTDVNTTKSITFVCAHLAAHGNMVTRRNEDFAMISRNLIFSDLTGMYDSDHLFFAGDLNYRTSDLIGSFDRVADEEELLMELLESDQLKAEHSLGRTLHGLEEASIKFPPTFKFLKDGSGRYNTKRWPSWCDRILFLSKKIKIIRYDALLPIKHSDHRPVFLEALIELSQNSRLNSLPHKENIEARNIRRMVRQFELTLGVGIQFAPFIAAAALAYIATRILF